MAERRGRLWRRLLSGGFLILFCLAAPLALVAGWARLTVVDAEVYARTVRDVADDPGVQNGIGQVVTTRAEAILAGENPTATEALQSRVAAEVIGEATRGVVAGEEFRETWEAANRDAHRLLATGRSEGRGQPVALDFSPLLDEVQAEIEALDIDVPPDLDLDAEDLRIEVLDAATADRVRLAGERLDVAFGAALAAALLSLVLSVGLAADRLAAVVRAGFGLATAMAALIVLMLIAQEWLTGEAGAEGGMAIGAIVEAISQGLRVSAVGLALLGLLLAGLFTGMRALRGSTVRRTTLTE